MSHLAPERLVELSLDATAMNDEERAHLAGCAICAGELDAELALGAALDALPRPEPSATFVRATRAAWEEAVARRQRRATALGLLVTLLLGNLAAAFAIGLVIANASPLAHGAALALNHLVILLRALSAAAAAVPLVPLVTVVFACAVALGLSALVGRLAFAAAEAK